MICLLNYKLIVKVVYKKFHNDYSSLEKWVYLLEPPGPITEIYANASRDV